MTTDLALPPFTSLTYAVRERTAIITFATPDNLNAITDTRLGELEAALALVEADQQLGALVVSGGDGAAFCVGLDLSLLDKAFSDIPYFETVVTRLNGIISRIEALPIPTIAAINGFARAGGFELPLGCDFILMADEAKIGDVHTDAGVLPATASLRLKRRIGEQRAKELIWSARWLKGQEAVDFGLAWKSVPRAALLETALAMAASFTDKPRACIASNKAVFQQGEELGTAAGAALEIALFVKYMAEQPYGREGYNAYREKRQPFWKAA